MTTLTHIRQAMQGRAPRLIAPPEGRRAAVAAVLCEEGEKVSLLFILRTRREGDPWSGHIAFPGGSLDETDESPRAAAERETREELGLDLGQAEYLGRLDDMATHLHTVHVAGFLYAVAKRPDLTLSDEVQRTFWMPLRHLADPARQVTTRVRGVWGERRVPALDLLGEGHPALWGLTYRFVAQVLRLAGVDLPGGTDTQITPSILFLLGPSGAGKTSLGQYLAREHGWLHLEIDAYPSGDGIDMHGLRREWDAYLLDRNPAPLIQTLYRRCEAAGKGRVVLSFPCNLLPHLTPEHVEALSGKVALAVLAGEPAYCKAAFMRREAQSGRTLSEAHWHHYNDGLFGYLDKPYIAPYTIRVFEAGGRFRPPADLCAELFGRLGHLIDV
jgi:8-oxo-dGTP pyrophosphatase MutT (NUDIX family)